MTRITDASTPLAPGRAGAVIVCAHVEERVTGRQGSEAAGAAEHFRERAEAAIAEDDLAALRRIVLEIANEARDREWAQSCFIQLARHRDAEVRGNAILGFGHLARRFGRLDPQRVRRIVGIALVDPSPSVREKARSAALDLRTFLRWEFDEAS